MPKGIYEGNKGRIAWNKGIKMWENKENPKGMLGKHHSNETKRKMSEAKKGKMSEENRKKLSERMKGRKPALGKHWKQSEKTKKRMSESKRGIKNPSWKGGICYNSYSVDWTRTLRQSIRERDKYVCQLCKEKQGDYALDIHHKDYNKLNCNPDNLISLCRKCHIKTNINRNYWINYFKKYAKYN